MEPKSFDIYSGDGSSLSGWINEEGCLRLDSEIWGKGGSEKHYVFTKEETDQLFSTISLDDFIALCREQHLIGMEAFLSENNITYDSFTF